MAAAASKVGDWRIASTMLRTLPSRTKIVVRQAALKEAHFLRKQIIVGIRKQAPGGKRFKPLAPTTIAMRRFFGFRGTKALLNRGDLRNSIGIITKGDEIFIGVKRTAKNRKGKSLVDIASVHEFGSRPIIIKVTPKMRRFLHMVFSKAKLPRRSSLSSRRLGVIIVQIPARPFLRPVFEKHAKPALVKRRFERNISKSLFG